MTTRTIRADGSDYVVMSSESVFDQGSWAQPSIGLCAPIMLDDESRWVRLKNITSCSSTAVQPSIEARLRAEFEAWEAASDEDFINFERSL